MKPDLIWAYLIHLGVNFWSQPGSPKFTPNIAVDETVWKTTLEFLPGQGINTLVIDLGDAVQYETHPEISVAGAWSKDKLKKELDRIRLLGMTPIPKLNFSAGHDGWLGPYSRMISTPQYYQVCKDLILEMVELFGNPPLFHIGMDEETIANQRGYALARVRQGELWWHDLNYLLDVCEKAGARPWMWSDYCCRNRQDFLTRMSKCALQSNRYYGSFKKKADGSWPLPGGEVYELLEEAGFDQVLGCSVVLGMVFGNRQCDRQTMELGKTFSAERVKGYIATPSYMTDSSDIYALLQEAQWFGEARQAVYGDFE